MRDLTNEQVEVVSGGNILGVIAVVAFFTSGGYQNAVDFTSGFMTGFMNAQ